jgi:hypothetical protein
MILLTDLALNLARTGHPGVKPKSPNLFKSRVCWEGTSTAWKTAASRPNGHVVCVQMDQVLRSVTLFRALKITCRFYIDLGGFVGDTNGTNDPNIVRQLSLTVRNPRFVFGLSNA